MSTRNEERFAGLLTEAVHTIKRHTSKPIAAVQDELMYALGRETGNPVEYWRKGHIPASQAEFVQLSRELVVRGNLSREWLHRFWGCTDFVGLVEVERELFPAQETARQSLPQRPYERLVGREELTGEILGCLIDEARKGLVAIDGMGGIGKTALAYAVMEQALHGGAFDSAVWVREDAAGPGEGLTYAGTLNAIGLGLGLRDATGRGIAAAEERIAGLLRAQRILLVLDNLETAAEPQAQIAAQVAELLGPHSRALLTSRQRFVHGVYHIHLGGLSSAHGGELLRQEAQARGVVHVAQAGPEELARIVGQTGGSPLALKLAVGQLAYQPADVVAARFQSVRLLQEETDEYARFYRSIFFPSWKLLSGEGRQLLVAMSHFAPGVGGTFPALKAAAGLPIDALAERIDELWRLAFLEIGEASVSSIRYYLHTLTRHFVLSDIVQMG
ncbi:MAG: hypothetical protein KF753_10480 [Caldilineaceae bacterium]|nr:hypothetical protein [Caldilineaceae bacterium]